MLVSYYPNHPKLHSFPTRRSSDLGAAKGHVESDAFLATGAHQVREPLAEGAVHERQGPVPDAVADRHLHESGDRKSTRLNSSHSSISYAVFCLKKKKNNTMYHQH